MDVILNVYNTITECFANGISKILLKHYNIIKQKDNKI